MANEKRLIDAKKLFNDLADYWGIPRDWDGRMLQTCEDALSMIEDAPTVDAVEVVHGRWVEKVDMVESYFSDCTEVFYECSVCQAPNIGESPYCPNCGAKMDGGNEDG